MLNINNINYRIKKSTKAHGFIPSIFNKSSTAGNITVFKDFNINQIVIKKINLQ